MRLHYHGHKRKLLSRMNNYKGILFHIVGIACIIWFLVRVLPKPDRIRYPCQQMSITVALGYIAFWSVLFFGLIQWIKRAKSRTVAFVPSILVIFMMIFALTTPVFAGTLFNSSSINSLTMSRWDPIPKEPIGTPQGVNPGRVAWAWNPNATETELTGYWWQKENNDQTALDQMYSDGLQSLADEEDDYDAWDQLFRYFNVEHGNGDIGYQSGEQIAIKINMNNGYIFPYNWESDDIDANPYVVKALLRQLVDVVGVAQEDITVYDASRKLMNWFYNRVYYAEYPSGLLIPEFPDVNFVDNDGGATGRQKIVASNQRVYFAYTIGSCKYRTLPTCVTEADYLINMPIIKRHLGPCVTLAGKNLFGSWVEDVLSVHVYHAWGIIMGNPAPQTDLLAHEQLGKKTLLYVGDDTYGCRGGNTDISRFQMYPFNDDWMSSLFFSQDGVAVDSVMYDFLHAEGTGPSEGAQNYLHQSAEPPAGVYDPENDGVYLSDSLGVHEHWDTNIDIFSSDRYSGPDGDGIDYIAVDNQYGPPDIPTIDGPRSGNTGEEYDYTFVTTDPYGENVYYYIDWGDGDKEEWIGPYGSGEEVTVNHTWSENGAYIIKAKAKNIFGTESEWGTFPVIMPKNQQISQQSSNPFFFQILQRLMNTR